jgi:hypothetical protein
MADTSDPLQPSLTLAETGRLDVNPEQRLAYLVLGGATQYLPGKAGSDVYTLSKGDRSIKITAESVFGSGQIQPRGLPEMSWAALRDEVNAKRARGDSPHNEIMQMQQMFSFPVPAWCSRCWRRWIAHAKGRPAGGTRGRRHPRLLRRLALSESSPRARVECRVYVDGCTLGAKYRAVPLHRWCGASQCDPRTEDLGSLRLFVEIESTERRTGAVVLRLPAQHADPDPRSLSDRLPAHRRLAFFGLMAVHWRVRICPTNSSRARRPPDLRASLADAGVCDVCIQSRSLPCLQLADSPGGAN